jgi:hypothetical protein
MKKVWTYFALTMVLLVLSFPTYAENLPSRQQLAPYSLPPAGWVTAISPGAGGRQTGHVVKVDIYDDPMSRWRTGASDDNGQDKPSPRREVQGHINGPGDLYLLHADWHLSEHVRMGAGYNFNGLSDDLTDFDYENEGVFIYLIGQM